MKSFKSNFNFLTKLLIISVFLNGFSIFSEDFKKKFEKDEYIGGKDLIKFYDHIGPNGIARLKKRYSFGIGFDGFNAITAASFAYNLNQYFSLGFTHFFGNLNSYSSGAKDGIYASHTGILSAGYEATYQVSSQTFGVPKFGNAIFLQFYPLMFRDVPIYISFHLGRTETTKIINNANVFPENVFVTRNRTPFFETTIHELPSTYYATTLGYRYIALDGNVYVGIEAGRIYLPDRTLKVYNRQNLFDLQAVSLNEYIIYDFQIKDSIKLDKTMHLN